MRKKQIRRGQILEYRGIQFVYARMWPEGPCIVPIIVGNEPKTTTEFRSQTGKGAKLIAQCWNVRNISYDVANKSHLTKLGRLPLSEVNQMWRVVQHAFTGIAVPEDIKKDTGHIVTGATYREVMNYQSKWARKVHPIQEDLLQKYT